MKKHSLRFLGILGAAALLLAGCGGGGGGGDANVNEPRPTTELGSSRQYEGICDIPTQKKFVRSYLDQYYLWYDEIQDVDPARYATAADYFYALRVRTLDANGLPKDRFSEALPASLVQEALRQSRAPQEAAFTDLLANHTDSVPVTKVVIAPGGQRVGYIQFNDHSTGAQDDLIAAFRQLEGSSIQDLVLDLRFNSGGFLYIALTAASMITGPENDGKVFEQLHYNSKRVQDTANSTLLFSGQVQVAETQNPVGTPLPRLNLQRVFILASPRTCSASESIINALRGIDVQVIRIGTTEVNEAGVRATCGKPYGFREKDNCGIAYFPIEFKGTNAKGFGDYTTGFPHTCEVQNSSSPSEAGSTTDSLLNAALAYVDTGACPTGTATDVQSRARPILSEVARPNRPSWAGRLLLRQQAR